MMLRPALFALPIGAIAISAVPDGALTDDDGALLTDDDGAYLLEEA